MLELPLLLLRRKVTVVLSRLNGLLHVQEGGVVRKINNGMDGQPQKILAGEINLVFWWPKNLPKFHTHIYMYVW